MKTPIGKQYVPNQSIPQVPFQGHQTQTQPFQHLYHNLGARKQGQLYICYQNPPYPGT